MIEHHTMIRTFPVVAILLAAAAVTIVVPEPADALAVCAGHIGQYKIGSCAGVASCMRDAETVGIVCKAGVGSGSCSAAACIVTETGI